MESRFSEKPLIFINLSSIYAQKLGIPGSISDDVYHLIHHPAQNNDFLLFSSRASVWGRRALIEKAYYPFKKKLLQDLAGFESWLSGYYRNNRPLFLGIVFYGRQVEKSNVHIELARFNKLYSIVYVEYFKQTYADTRDHIKCFYLHHFLEELCRKFDEQGASRIEEVSTEKLKNRLTQEPELDQIETYVRENWSDIWADYLRLRG